MASFDLVEHGYTTVDKKIVDKKFPGRHTVIAGDSTKTVPEFTRQNPDARFDLPTIKVTVPPLTPGMTSATPMSAPRTRLVTVARFLSDGYGQVPGIRDGPAGRWGARLAPGSEEFCRPAMHSPIRPGRHTPPVPVITFDPVDVASQQMPVRLSATVPAGQDAAASGAVSTGTAASAPPHIATVSRRVIRVVMVSSGGFGRSSGQDGRVMVVFSEMRLKASITTSSWPSGASALSWSTNSASLPGMTTVCCPTDLDLPSCT